MIDLTAETIRDLMDYDPIAGTFTWKVNRRGPAKVGAIAGCKNADGYITIGVNGRVYYSHRLAWLYVYGEWPRKQIDHINFICDDNRIANLRQATPSENRAHLRRQRNNKSGFKGVHFNAATGMWRAQIKKDRRLIVIGLFTRPEDAHFAYCKIAMEHFGEYASPG